MRQLCEETPLLLAEPIRYTQVPRSFCLNAWATSSPRGTWPILASEAADVPYLVRQLRLVAAEGC